VATVDKLLQISAKAHLARITRAGQSSVHDHGFILDLSATLVLFHYEFDFRLDGYSVVRVADITAVRSGQYERFTERVFRKEGLIDAVGLDDPPDLTDWRALLFGLKQLKRNVIVECEFNDDERDEFYIGRIERVNQASFSLRHFDALGRWDAAPTQIRYESVTKVRFAERYIEVFSRHLRPR
jgi:hypothetical protein